MKQKSNVWIFMLVAYGFSWLFWIPDALIAQEIWNAPEGVKSFRVSARKCTRQEKVTEAVGNLNKKGTTPYS